MTTIRTKRFVAALGLSATLLLAGGAQAGDITYEIAVDTSLFQSTSGYLDFQLNPGNPPVDQATATISGFTTDGTLGAVLPDMGDVSGSLPGSVVINNTDVTNEYTQAFTIGSFFDVFVELDIPTVSGNATGGNIFTLDLQDSGFNSLFATSPAAAIEIGLDATTGEPTVTNNTNGAAEVTQTPEPSTFVLIGIGLVSIGWRNRARVSRAARALYI